MVAFLGGERMRHIIFLLIGTGTIALSYFILTVLTSSSIVYLLGFTLLGIVGFVIQRKIYQFFMIEFNFNYLGKDVEIPKTLIIIRDTSMDLAFIFVLAAFGTNPITDFIETKTPSFSIHWLYVELAITNIMLAILPTFLYCIYYIWKNPSIKKKAAE